MATFHSLGAKAVAACATLSFASTLSLCAFITHLVIRYRGIATSSTPSSTGIRFLRTPAGYIFLNLLAADTTQALGFALTWHWARRGGIDASSQLCLLQAVAIQAGDVASCIFSLYIAIYTATLLTIARRPSDKLLHISCGSAWLFVALMTCLGPLAVAKQDKGPFYGQAGNWCWIATPYEGYRLYFHYLLIFVSTAGQLFSYLAIFVIIRFRLVPKRKKLTDVEHENKAVPLSPMSLSSKSSSQEAPPSPRRQLPTVIPKRVFDRTSILMLLYPLVNLVVVMPLSIYRIMALAGTESRPEALATCGCIFALGGFVNAVLYASSRHLLSIHPKREETPRRVMPGPSLWPFRKPYNTHGHGTTTLGRISIDENASKPTEPCEKLEKSHRRADSSASSTLTLDIQCNLPSWPVPAITVERDSSAKQYIVNMVRPSSRQQSSQETSGVAVSHEVVVRSEK